MRNPQLNAENRKNKLGRIGYLLQGGGELAAGEVGGGGGAERRDGAR